MKTADECLHCRRLIVLRAGTWLHDHDGFQQCSRTKATPHPPELIVEPIEDCPAFAYIGQQMPGCDRCGEPIWDHDFDAELGTPFGVFKQAAWSEQYIADWLERGRITEERAEHLRTVEPSRDPVKW